MKGTKVTAQSLENDEDGAQEVTIFNNYVLVTDGSCYQASVVAHANGTHVITVKGVSR